MTTKANKLQTVIDFYSALLEDVDLTTTGDGFVSFNAADGVKKPVTISGNRLCLPTQELLKEGNWEKRLAFHPLSEQFSTSLSPVMNAFKSYVRIGLTKRYMQIIVALAELASDPTRHKNLGSKIGKVLKTIGTMDEKTYSNVKSITRKILDTPESRLVNILMRSGAKEKAMRTTVITHPIVEGLKEAFENGNTSFLKVSTLRKLDLEPIFNLFNYVVDGTDGITTSSSDRTAPYFHSLLLAWQDAANHINEMIEFFGPKVPSIAAIEPFKLEWAEKMEEFAEFATSHNAVAPVLPGSRPVVEDEEEEAEKKRQAVFEGNDIAVEPTKHKDVIDSVPWSETPRSESGVASRSVSELLAMKRGGGGGRSERDYDRDGRDYGRGSYRSERGGRLSLPIDDSPYRSDRGRDYGRRDDRGRGRTDSMSISDLLAAKRARR